MFCYRLLAALALIMVQYIYIGLIVRALAATFVMHMHNCKSVWFMYSNVRTL